MTFEKLRGLTVVVLGMQIGQGSLRPVGNNKQWSKKFETLNKTEYLLQIYSFKDLISILP